jgi:hypothetical protein
MRKVLVLAGVLLALAASRVAAQFPIAYDPFFVLPGKAKALGVDVGLINGKVSKIADMSDVYAMAKHSVNDKLEIGGRATFGFLVDGGDAFSAAVVGAKYSMRETCALNANFLIPAGSVDDPGLSVGLMHVFDLGDGLMVNVQPHVGLLKGYAPKGVALHALVEPTKALNDQLTAYLDISVRTNTDDIGGSYLAINLTPNVDCKVNDKIVANVGVSLGIAGDAKQADPGIALAVIMDMGK